MKRSWRAATCVVAALCVTGVTAGQQEAPVFRGGVELVLLDVSVLDERRRPVRGLTADDFTVLEEGEPRPVVSFSAVELPAAPGGPAWLREVATDVATNGRVPERVVVIVMDDFHTPFDPGVVDRAKRIGRAVIDQLGAGDMAAVLHTSSQRSGQTFTRDRDQLREAVERFVSAGGQSAPPHRFSAAFNPRVAPVPPVARGECPGGRCVQDAMRNAAEILREWPGRRKTLVLVSPFLQPFRTDNLFDLQIDAMRWGEVFAAMQEANLNIYQYDPRGLEVGASITDDLQTLSEATGGRAVFGMNQPWIEVPAMFAENSAYYVLGFEPAPGDGRRRMRRIDVRVDRPGVTTRSRRGYLPAREDDDDGAREPVAPIEAALAGGLPTGDLPTSLAAAVFPRAGRDAAVHVVTSFTPASLAAAGEDFDVLVSAYRNDGRHMGTVRQRVSARRAPGSAGPPRAELPATLELEPGRYEIRTAAGGLTSGQVGSAFTSIVVPDFAREPLALSGLLVELVRDREGPDAGTVRMPTTARTFGRGDRVEVFLRVTQGGRREPAPVRVGLALEDATGTRHVELTDDLPASAFAESRSAPLRIPLPLDTLPAGECLLSIDVRMEGDAEHAASRRLRFAVGP